MIVLLTRRSKFKGVKCETNCCSATHLTHYKSLEKVGDSPIWHVMISLSRFKAAVRL